MIDTSRVLQFDYRGAPQTINVMRRAALESQTQGILRDFVERSCADLDSKDYLSEYLAIYYQILANCRYMRDPRTVELVRAPHLIARQLMESKQKPCIDCDDEAALMAACIMSVGGTARFATGAFRDIFFEGRRQFSHVWCEAYEPRSKRWIILDPVAAERTKAMQRELRAVKYWVV